MMNFDDIDRRILKHLGSNGRLPINDLAERVGLSPTPCARRVRRLEENGVIQGYQARISRKALGKSICVLISVKLSRQHADGHSAFQQTVAASPEVTECLMVTGSADYLLKAWFPDIAHLRDFITTTIQNMSEVAETSTMLVVDEIDAETGESRID